MKKCLGWLPKVLTQGIMTSNRLKKNLGRKWQALCTQNPQHLSSPPLLLHVQACFAVQLPVIVAVLKPASHLFPVRLYDTLACTLIGKHH